MFCYITLKRDKQLRNSGEILRWHGSNLCVQFSSALEVSEVKMKTETEFPVPPPVPPSLAENHRNSQGARAALFTLSVISQDFLSICCVLGITLSAGDEHRWHSLCPKEVHSVMGERDPQSGTPVGSLSRESIGGGTGPLEKSHQHPSRTGLDLDLEGSMALAGQTSSEEHLGKENPECGQWWSGHVVLRVWVLTVELKRVGRMNARLQTCHARSVLG